MKKFLCFIALLSSMSSFANSELSSFEPNRLCPFLGAHTAEYDLHPYEIVNCFEIIEDNKFSIAPAQLCLDLVKYTDGAVTGTDINSCFDAIANKEYSDERVGSCRNLRKLNSRLDRKTFAFQVTDCLRTAE